MSNQEGLEVEIALNFLGLADSWSSEERRQAKEWASDLEVSKLPMATLLPWVYEALLPSIAGAEGKQTQLGSFYTPDDVVDSLIDKLSLDWGHVNELTVIDPSCGAGNFLRGYLRLARQAPNVDLAQVARKIYGTDIDEGAVFVCVLSIWLEVGLDLELLPIFVRNIHRCDSLIDLRDPSKSGQLSLFEEAPKGSASFQEVFESGGFDLVIGNPPFLNQLETETSTDSHYSRKLEERFGNTAKGYVDIASLFFIVAAEILKPASGRLCLIQPDSFLSARDSRGVRDMLSQQTSVDFIWLPKEKIFSANVNVCAVAASLIPTTQHTVMRFTGRSFESLDEITLSTTSIQKDGTWGVLLSGALGAPAFHLQSNSVIGQYASATADFRDQYYPLAPYVHESEGCAGPCTPLVTTGLVDWMTNEWGRKQTRFNKVSYEAPEVSIRVLGEEHPDLYRWSQSRLWPKILVATQTKVIEAWPDVDGVSLPSIPLISVVPFPGYFWMTLAAILSPVTSLVAFERFHGSALSSDAIKLSATQLMSMPAPSNSDLWVESAGILETSFRTELTGADIERFAEVSVKSYGEHSPDVVNWWLNRLNWK
jgi:hypothetical protein